MKRLGYWTAPLLMALLLSACTGPRVLSGFGDLPDGEGKPRSGPHGGVDVWGYPGDPVLASADGRVRAVGDEGVPNSCGKYVVIDHETVLKIQDIRFRGGHTVLPSLGTDSHRWLTHSAGRDHRSHRYDGMEQAADNYDRLRTRSLGVVGERRENRSASADRRLLRYPEDVCD